MQVSLLGTGGPRPDPSRQGPATLVQAGGLNLVFDAGRGVATQLVKAGLSIVDIDAIFITHHHFDHIGGFGDLLMAIWNNGRTETVPVYGPTGTSDIVSTLLTDVYWRDVNYRLAEEQAMGNTIGPPTALYAVHEIMGGQISLPGPEHEVAITVGQVEHGTTALNLANNEWASIGYRVRHEDRVVAISGDAVAGRDLAMLTSGADVLVMCAYLAASDIVSKQLRFLSEKIIAGVPQAAAIAQDSGVKRLVLTHIREHSLSTTDEMRAEAEATFDGEVLIGHDLMRIDL